MPVADNEVFVVAHPVDARFVESVIPTSRQRFLSHRAVIYSGPGGVEYLVGLFRGAGRETLKLLDRFVFLLGDEGAQSGVFEDFFDYIAPDYERLIDTDSNVDNVRQLLACLSSVIGDLHGKVVVDFGCGTGLAVPIIRSFGASVIAVDQSSRMRELAAAAVGMNVLRVSELNSIRLKADGIIASYVLHLLWDDSVLETLWAVLKPGGALVANFHKKIGVDRANRFFSRPGTTLARCSAQFGDQSHGPVFAYVKS
jgi:SAM-dependent methyltransferase